MTDLERLQELNCRLTSLLDNPEPGLGTWWWSVREVLESFAALVPKA